MVCVKDAQIDKPFEVLNCHGNQSDHRSELCMSD